LFVGERKLDSNLSRSFADNGKKDVRLGTFYFVANWDLYSLVA
jgi:hypothetical protein